MRREQIVWSIIGIIFFVGFLCVVPAHYKICEANYYTEHEICTPHQLVPFLLTKVVSFFNFAGAAVTASATVFIAIFTWTLKRSTDKLWKATIDADLERAKETKILQRAYLSVEPGGINLYLDGTDRLSCDVIIHNAGNLPANHVSWFLDRVISPTGTVERFDIGRTEGNIILAPSVKARKGTKNPLPRNDVLKFKPTPENRSENWIYVWGRVEYNDGFREGRFIEFCHRYSLGAADQHGAVDAKAGRYHESGNRTDES